MTAVLAGIWSLAALAGLAIAAATGPMSTPPITPPPAPNWWMSLILLIIKTFVARG